MQFGIAIGWAGVLLQMTGGESGGFHFWEISTRGKTTIQQASASLWGAGTLTGGFIQRWRSTANNLEATFAAASDTCLVLDELRQAAHGEVATIVYTLTGEVGKGRLRADASARTPYSWRVLLLSSGETPIASRLNEDRYQRDGRSKEALGGATVRVIDIPADRAHGAFDQPPGVPDFNPAAFAEKMQKMTAAYHGTAGPAFVKALIEEKGADARVCRAVDDFVASVLAADAEGQLRRVARRFGLVAVAGTMAIGAGIVDWDVDAFLAGVRGLFRSWAKARGSGPIEDVKILAFARSLWAKYGRLRFEHVGADLGREVVVSERWGYRRDEPHGQWFVFPSVFEEQFASLGARRAIEVLFRHGILERGTEKDRWTKRVQLPGLKQQNFYVINEKIFEGSDETSEAKPSPGVSTLGGKAGST
jgi:putative DNA primase/helicase